MKILGVTLTIAAAITLGACSRVEARSEDYFHDHLDEARQVVAECRDGSARGEECANADYAVQLAKAEAQRDHFFMKDQ